MTSSDARPQQTEPTAATPHATPPLDDSGLRCPQCRYNLTGLSAATCPECGRALDWEALRRELNPSPKICFERWRGVAKLGGFLATWLTIMLAPWVFARRAVMHIGTAHALAFGGLCFASTFLSLFFDNNLNMMASWLTTALVYLVLQTALLTLSEPNGWREPLKTARFWALIGGYTSAIMCTEFVKGPPFVFLSSVIKFLLGRSATVTVPLLGDHPLYSWLQMGVWLIGLACCYYARMRRRGADGFSALSASFLTAACLFLLYAATVEHIGYRLLYEFFDNAL